ncbi:dihydrodipicolinate synthase family protein [Halosimplex amylolyticum]|uniref:dihydrodipicolinate synthase family protein n=1 Tax=Halosimplex amylolyticum TaxID=3396616 RepID=UPI003F557062
MPAAPGNCPIVATPFTADGAVDHESLRNEIHTIADAGCEAATMFGIASEFFKLSDDERLTVAETVVDACGAAGIASVLSVTHGATRVAVEHAETYDALGADCVMVFPPRRRGTAEEVLDHVRRIGEAVSVPVMVQHTPRNVDVEPERFAALNREVPNVRYFKVELDPPGPYISDLDDETGDDVSILVGNWGFDVIDAYDRGAVGVMPIAIYPELYVAIDGAHRSGDRERAVDLHAALLAFLNEIRGVPHAKWVMRERGVIDSAYCRPPVGDQGDERTQARLEAAHERLRETVEEI